MKDSKNSAIHILLQQIVHMLDELLAHDESGHIDMAQLSLSMEERGLLLEILGENGTQAEVTEYGHFRIASTGIPGVWWVIHLDGMEHVISEFIEISYCPEVLVAATEDIREGRDILKARLLGARMTSTKANPEA